MQKQTNGIDECVFFVSLNLEGQKNNEGEQGNNTIGIPVIYGALENSMVLAVPPKIIAIPEMAEKVEKITKYIEDKAEIVDQFLQSFLYFSMATNGEAAGIMDGEAICAKKEVKIRAEFTIPKAEDVKSPLIVLTGGKH